MAQRARERLTAVEQTLTNPTRDRVFPLFDALPSIPGQPQGCLWTFFDTEGQKDEIGTLNLLTPAVVRQASSEIKIGQHIQLDWCFDNAICPSFGRKGFEHRIVDKAPQGASVLDDEVAFNTQCCSQWDSLKHFGHQATAMHYNGLTHERAAREPTNGIHNWCERGGIVGRGVLVDWLSWYEQKHGKAPSPVTRHEIPVHEVEECLEHQRTTTRQGDVLIIRSGYVRWHNTASFDERQQNALGKGGAIGLQGSEATVRWLYEHHFAAVAGDALAFEAWPPKIKAGWCLHEWLLTQWGTPIGELWDLETLSAACKRVGRWTFFLTSAPLHVKGGVGSPPGAIAIL